MRWFCLDPELPENATLRIRTAPNSDAATCGSVAKGKAIAVHAPAFEVADGQLQQTIAASAAPQQWLHVVFPDEFAGATREGYVMANLPDGMRLMVPWEYTDRAPPHVNLSVRCHVWRRLTANGGNKKAALFDGPSKTAHAVGLIEDGEGVRYPYGVSAADGSRARIYHNVHRSVWIEIAELEPVCVRLRHANCSTAHAFYTLNSELPPEAQIAIRSFPSKESETVGLLSRGEVIEVVARCGDWLQVLSAETGDQESWIMWKTDSWTLLVELDQSSELCTRASDVADRAPTSPRDQEPSEDAGDAELNSNQSHSLAPVNEGADLVAPDAGSVNPPTAMPNRTTSDDVDDNDQMRHGSEGVESLNNAVTAEETSKSTREDADAGDNLEELCEEMASSDLSPRHADETVHESALAVNNWDERPLNVKHRQDTEDQQPASVSDEESSEHFVVTYSSEALAEDATEMEVDQEHSLDQGDSLPNGKDEAPISSVASWDDRPIHPQQNAWSWDDAFPADGQSGNDQAEQQLQRTGADPGQPDENAPSQSNELDETLSRQPVDEKTNDTSMVGDTLSWDDKPIRPQHKPLKFEEEDVEESGKIDTHVSPEDRDADLDRDNGTDSKATGSNSAWDDRPIRPQTKPFKFEAEEVNQIDTTDVSSESGDRINSSWDDRPVRPKREPFKFELDDAEEGCNADAEMHDPAGLSIDEAAHDLKEDQPITVAAANSWDERPIGSGDRVETKADSMGEDIEDDNEMETEPIRDEMLKGDHFWDDRPIRPQRNPFNFELDGAEDVGSADTQVPLEEGAEVLEDRDGAAHEPTEVHQTSASTYSWDERPIGSSAKIGLKTEYIDSETGRDPVSVDSETDAYDAQAEGVKSFSSWDETPVGSTRPRSLPKSPENVEIVENPLDEQYQSSRSVSSWDETPVGQAKAPIMPASPEHKHEEVVPAEEQSVNSRTELAHNANERNALDGEAAIGHIIEDDQVDYNMELEVTSAHSDELRGDSNSPPRSNDDISSDDPMNEEPESMDVEHDEALGDRDADTNGAMEDEIDDVRDYRASSPEIENMTDGSTHYLAEDTPTSFRGESTAKQHDVEPVTTTVQANSKEFNSSELPSDDMEVPVDHEMHTNAQQDRTTDRSSRAKLDSDFGKSSKHDEKVSPTPRKIVYEHRFGMAALTHAERQSGSLSFLLEFGIRAYCRHKQIMITSDDEISQILYEAVVFGDDPEAILETLVADDPPSQDWIAYSPSKVLSGASEGDPHSFLDVLYARESGEPPSTPKRMQPQHVDHLSTPPHPGGRRREKMDSMFNRTRVKQQATPTFDLIMNNADVDKILEAEFGDEVCELAILGPYKYPTLSGRRLPGSAARSAMGDYGASTSTYSRLSSSSQPIGVTAATRRDEEVQESPGMASANPLKRAASAITRTPPVHVAKAAPATPAIPPVIPVVHAEAERPKVPSTLPPPASRFGAKPPTMAVGASSSLRRLPSQPSGITASASSVPESTLPRKTRSSQSLLSEPSATTSKTSVTGTLPRPGQSLLQRKSFLPTPNPSKYVASTVNRNSIAGSITQATDTSSMQARRASFGFVRPKTVVPKK